MNEEKTQIMEQPKAQIAMTRAGLQFKTLEEIYRFAKCVSMSGFAPKGMERPESVVIALEMGMEIGLPPMASLQNIAVINGRPSIYGDAALAVVRGSGLLEFYKEEEIGEYPRENFGYKVSAKRIGDAMTYSETFTIADAKAAQLWGKPGPWTQYSRRMLKFRARGFLLRDAFGDVLKGLRTAEEVQDFDVSQTAPQSKLFGKKEEPKVEDAQGEVVDTVPVSPELENPNPPVFDEEEKPKRGRKPKAQNAVDELNAKLAEEGLTEFQLMEYARRQQNILAGGKLDEFGASKILNAWETVKEIIAAMPKA